jgi:hypothetical protein
MLPCVGINVVTPMDGDVVGSKVGNKVEFVVSLVTNMSRKNIVLSLYLM